MIIDEILDRKDGFTYTTQNFYDYIKEEEPMFFEDTPITKALESGDEERVKKELCWYVISQNYYSVDIIKFIMSVTWLEEDITL